MSHNGKTAAPLRETLDYEPVELHFGSSGLRALVADISQLEAYVNTRGFLDYLLRLRRIRRGQTVYCAGDLRPSTDQPWGERGGRGLILQAVCRAVEDAGLQAGCLGKLPTPALLYYAMRRRAASVMVTGSHIPFDRNGLKFHKPSGEVLKSEEAPILAAVAAARAAEYRLPAAESPFDAHGMLKPERQKPLPPPITEARCEYLRRYLDAFPAGVLAGSRILVYQHSSVSRDLLVEVLQGLGAQAVAAGRSETFIPVDTEAVDQELLQTVQALVEEHGGASLDAVVSADGDGDRPLVLAIEKGRVRFIPGDLLGILAADFLKARAVTVPINANEAVDLFFRARGIEPRRTPIGSPYVIAAMREVGWEANGGFLTAVPLSVPGGGTLEPLPTRDALLPILCVLAASSGSGVRLIDSLNRLPPRFGHSALIRPFGPERSQRLAALLAPPSKAIEEARFAGGAISIRTSGRRRPRIVRSGAMFEKLQRLRRRLEAHFTVEEGFAPIASINWLDGMRIGLEGGEVVHLRASRNAPEYRAYTLAGSRERAQRLAELTLKGGILQRLEREAQERRAIEAFRAEPRPLRLRGAVQHYAWGGTRFIAELIGSTNDRGDPFAELWLGAHPKAPAAVELEGGWLALNRLIAEAPRAVLGPRSVRRFGGRLPYLLKILDARDMLSIQVHPSLRRAREGFARENAAGIPLSAPQRSYRDDNPKPELLAALSEFWLLHGFRPLEQIAEILASRPELQAIYPDFQRRLRLCRWKAGASKELLRSLCLGILELPQPQADAVLQSLLTRLQRRESLDKDGPDYWVLRASRIFAPTEGRRDRGLLWIYLLNLMHLQPGQAIFQPPGLPHAYLEGTGVEIMANSDNVLRAGLTVKHSDAAELLKILRFESAEPSPIEARDVSDTERLFPAPAREFRLSRIEVSPDRRHRRGARHGVECLIALEGEAALRTASAELSLPRGEAALVPAGLPYCLKACADRAVLYRATAPG